MAEQYQQKLTHEYVERVQSGARSLESLETLESDIRDIATSGEPPHMVTGDVKEIYLGICEALTVLKTS